LADLVSRWQELRRQGKPASPEEVCAECPERVEELKRHLQAVGAMESFLRLGAGAETPTLSPTPPAGDEGADPAATMPPPAAQQEAVTTEVVVPGYEVLGELGRGGMGVVYRARQTRLNRLVALKMILTGVHAGSEQLARFRAEAQVVARLQHPQIVNIYDVGEHQGLPYLALEYVDGGNLAQLLEDSPRQSVRRAAELTATLAAAVEHAHRCGIVHRDLKPANVLLMADGTPKVTDFGLAKQLDAGTARTASGAILGTPSYMAPEQAGGKGKHIGPATDVYALGAILYELLTGRPPFRAEAALDTLMQVMSEDVVPPARLRADCPRDLDAICLKWLQKKPAERYASAAALAEDLQRYLAGKPVQTLQRQDGRSAGQNRRRRWLTVGALTGVTLLLAALAVFIGNRYLGHGRGGVPDPAGMARLEADPGELQAAKAGAMPTPAQGGPVFRAMLEKAPEILQFLRDHRYRRVGILRFGVQKDGKIADNAVALGLNLPRRLETALLLKCAVPEDNDLVLLNTTGQVDPLTREGRALLFKPAYMPLGGKNDPGRADAFLTGQAEFSKNLRTITISISALDSQSNIETVTTFSTNNDLNTLVEAGESFQLAVPATGLKRGRTFLDDDLDTVADEAIKEKKETPAGSHPLEGLPVLLEVHYKNLRTQQDKVMEVAVKEGEAVLREPTPDEGVTFVLKRNDPSTARYGLVLMVNGVNTLYEERLPPKQCTKWIMEPSTKPIRIEGFRVKDASGERLVRFVLPLSEADVPQYGADAGTIHFAIFREQAKTAIANPPAKGLPQEAGSMVPSPLADPVLLTAVTFRYQHPWKH
jgi:serine/threonine-protein kinase